LSDRITVSLIKADVGGYVGHSAMHDAVMNRARRALNQVRGKLLTDFFVGKAGDDLELLMVHKLGVDNPRIHKLAWDTFVACTEVARELKLYGAGQDLLVDAFSGNIKGMGPGAAEMEFVERTSEPILVFMADKTSPGAWNIPFYKIFADPFNTPGLVIDTKMHEGFIFSIHDAIEGKHIEFKTPEESYDLLMFLGAPNRFVVESVRPRHGTEVAAVASTTKMALIAGRYVGKDDPVMLVRCQSGLPAVGEVTEAFSFPWIVPGWMRGSHHGPLMPVAMEEANPSRFDGPPRVVCLGFQLAHGKLVGPRDIFADVSFDGVREEANRLADALRRHGPFEPHRLPLEELEYTTMSALQKKLSSRWVTDLTDAKGVKRVTKTAAPKTPVKNGRKARTKAAVEVE
jgi:fructose 1,6-bisphosphate aldolase/phosphatase